MMQLTYWAWSSKGPSEPDDFNEILTVYPKRKSEWAKLIAAKPANCVMISIERSGDVKKNGRVVNPLNSRHFRELWRVGQPLPEIKPKCCPLCGSTVVGETPDSK